MGKRPANNHHHNHNNKKGKDFDPNYSVSFDKISPDLSPGEIARRIEKTILPFGLLSLKEQVEGFEISKKHDPGLQPFGVVARILSTCSIKLMLRGLGCEHQPNKEKVAVITATHLPSRWYRDDKDLPFTVPPIQAAMEAIERAEAVLRSMVTYGKWAQRVLEACTAVRTEGAEVVLPDDIGEIPEFGTYHKWVYGVIWSDSYAQLKAAMEAANQAAAQAAANKAQATMEGKAEPEEITATEVTEVPTEITPELLEANLKWVDEHAPPESELRALRDLIAKGAVKPVDAVTAIQAAYNETHNRQDAVSEVVAGAEEARKRFDDNLAFYEEIAPDGDAIHTLRARLDKAELTLEQAERELDAYAAESLKKTHEEAEKKKQQNQGS